MKETGPPEVFELGASRSAECSSFHHFVGHCVSWVHRVAPMAGYNKMMGTEMEILAMPPCGRTQTNSPSRELGRLSDLVGHASIKSNTLRIRTLKNKGFEATNPCELEDSTPSKDGPRILRAHIGRSWTYKGVMLGSFSAACNGVHLVGRGFRQPICYGRCWQLFARKHVVCAVTELQKVHSLSTNCRFGAGTSWAMDGSQLGGTHQNDQHK